MAGYTSSFAETDGVDSVDAADFSTEYNAIEAAFHNSTGHKHDGTAAEGPVVALIGDSGSSPLNKVVVDTANDKIDFYTDVASSSVLQLSIQDGAIVPNTTDDIDIGSVSKALKDLYLNGIITFGGATTENQIKIPDNLAAALQIKEGTNAYITLVTTDSSEAITLHKNVDCSAGVDVTGNITVTGTVDGVDVAAHAAATSGVHGATGTIVGTSDTQTLTNKTLTSPTINGGTVSGITDLTVADGGTGASTASGARTNLGVAIGSDVQAFDAGLTSIAGLTTTADRMIYTTASDTYAVATLTAAGRALLDDADASAQRTTLGLGTVATLDSGTSSGNVPLVGTTSATDALAGTLETATQAEMETRTATDKAVTPGRQHYHPAMPKAWIVFDGSAATGTNDLTGVTSSYNISGLVKNGTGDYTIHFDVDFADTNYAMLGSGRQQSNQMPLVSISQAAGAFAVGSCRIVTTTQGTTPTDFTTITVVFYGDHA